MQKVHYANDQDTHSSSCYKLECHQSIQLQGAPFYAPMDPSNLTWSKPSKPMHSLPLSMTLSRTKSLAHLKYVMGPFWCLWVDPHHLGCCVVINCMLILRNVLFTWRKLCFCIIL